MINMYSAVFACYDIEKVFLLETKDTCDFIIGNMEEELSLERWNNLEDILKDLSGKKVNIITQVQAEKFFGKDCINKGVTIK